jgi:hypothetical protein
MAISASLADARRTTLTVCLCAALAASAAGAQPVGALPGFHNAIAARQAQRVPFAPFAAYSNRSPSSDARAPAVPGNTIPVTSCLDDGSDGTLRKVIEGASDGDTIDMTGLTCSLITLQSGALVSAVPSLTLLGPGLDALTIDGNNADRVLSGTNFDIVDITIAHGVVLSAPVEGGCILASGDLSLTRTTLSSCLVMNATTDGVGGAAVVLGDLTMHASTIANSKATGAARAAGGGAVVGGNAMLYDSAISGNTADASQSNAYGGGLFVDGATTLHASHVEENIARSSSGAAYGGGLSAPSGDVSVLDVSTISGNVAHSDTSWAYGGGIENGTDNSPPSTVKVVASTISDNKADSDCDACFINGGGVATFDSIVSEYSTFSNNIALCNNSSSSCSAGGGAIAAYANQGGASHVTLRNSTIAANSAISGGQITAFAIGGGMMGAAGMEIVVHNSTIAFNHAGLKGGGISQSAPTASSELVSTIVAGNDSDSGPSDIDEGFFGAGSTFGGAHNIVVAKGANVTLPNDTLTSDPLLLNLTSQEGGATQVIPFDAGSPAMDAGSNPDSLGCDQRGYPYRRTYGNAADIGAYEAQGEKHLFADNFETSSVCPPAP